MFPENNQSYCRRLKVLPKTFFFLGLLSIEKLTLEFWKCSINFMQSLLRSLKRSDHGVRAFHNHWLQRYLNPNCLLAIFVYLVMSSGSFYGIPWEVWSFMNMSMSMSMDDCTIACNYNYKLTIFSVRDLQTLQGQ